jgi:integrase
VGERGVNRVRAFDRGPRGLFIEFREQTPTGIKKVRLALNTSDRELAKAKADTLALEFRTQVKAKPTELKLGALFDKYENISRSKSASKRAHDQRTAEMFCRFFGANRIDRTLSAIEWNRFIVERRRGAIARAHAKPGKKVRDRIIEYDLRLLMATINFATVAGDGCGNSLLERNPLKGLPFPKEANPQRPVLSTAQYTALLTVARKVHPGLEIMLVLARETGHRIGSIRQLRWSDIDLPGGRVRWRAEFDKLGKEHVTLLTSVALTMLTAYQRKQQSIGDMRLIPAPRNPGQPCSRDCAKRWWYRAAKLAGLPTDARFGFHATRRQFASELKHLNLKDLCALGGWRSPQTILTCYVQADEATQREAFATRKEIRVAHG